MKRDPATLRTETLVIRVRPTLKEKINEEAKREDIPLASLVRRVLAKHYEAQR